MSDFNRLNITARFVVAGKKSRVNKHSASYHNNYLKIALPHWQSLFIGLIIGISLSIVCFCYYSTKENKANQHKKVLIIGKEQNKISLADSQAKALPQFEFYNELTKQQNLQQYKGANLNNKQAKPNMYFVQAGAFKYSADANKLKAQLALNGLEAQINIATMPDAQIWYQVLLGPFADKQLAIQQQKNLLAFNINGMLVFKQSK